MDRSLKSQKLVEALVVLLPRLLEHPEMHVRNTEIHA